MKSFLALVFLAVFPISQAIAHSPKAPPAPAKIVQTLTIEAQTVKPPVAYEFEESVDEKVDFRCVAVARYARSISSLRGVGVRLDDLSAFTAEPISATFPMQALRYDVYKHTDQNPTQTYERYIAMCSAEGYDGLTDKLRLDAEKQLKIDQFLQIDSNRDGLALIPKGTGRPDPKILSGPSAPRKPNPKILAPKK